MKTHRQIAVAVLLPTYNGARFLESQLRSLTENATQFTLHWLDDHSTDNTREIVRVSAQILGIDLCEWNQQQPQGIPGAFFQLLECAEADIYLFCDQDDIWQAGKIDVTVANLVPDVEKPVLCFSDYLMFKDSKPETLRYYSDETNVKGSEYLQEPWWFTYCPAFGHTIGFTRPLREIFLKHKDIARTHAAMHDRWMYLIAQASGTCRLLPNAPTTLYRQHESNSSGRKHWTLAEKWRICEEMRQLLSRQAEGFTLIAEILPPGPKLEQMLALAAIVGTLDQGHSPPALARLLRSGAIAMKWGPLWNTIFYVSLCWPAKRRDQFLLRSRCN